MSSSGKKTSFLKELGKQAFRKTTETTHEYLTGTEGWAARGIRKKVLGAIKRGVQEKTS